ncbi:Protein kinase-like domain superfamily protein [Abortiporus biennis]
MMFTLVHSSHNSTSTIIYITVPRSYHDDLRAMTSSRHDSSRLCLTHGDLSPRNLLYHNGRLSGMIDWECAAWLPEYWDYTNAVYNVRLLEQWCNPLHRMFPQYKRELEFWKVHNPW